MKVIILGTGNVAEVLGKKIIAGGHQVIQIVGRNIERAHYLGHQFSCNVVYNTRYLNPGADIYVLAVTDSALPALAAKVKLHQQLVVHTSAAVPIDVLSACSEHYGVLYPLQTLHASANELPDIPVLLNANLPVVCDQLETFAQTWAEKVQFASDEERLKLHVASVFVNNFSNHLFALAESYCKANALNFNLLLPLLNETVKRLGTSSPATIQTGPAIRGDDDTIAKHLRLLNENERLLEVYTTLTDSIKSLTDPILQY